MARILYIGNNHSASTSAHRADALKRLGHEVVVHNPFLAVAKEIGSYLNFIHYRTGYSLLQPKIEKWICALMQEDSTYDLVWVDSGELLGTNALLFLKQLKCPLVLYNIDDPTGKRDGGRFLSLRQALPVYDLVVVVRNETANDCQNLGANDVMRVMRSYDEVAHKPFVDLHEIPPNYQSDVAFIGTWMRHEKRDLFLLNLLKQGIPVSIWGDRWHKSPYWRVLKNAYKGGALGGRDYVAAIQGAKVCLGFLSKGNRDLHTTRSLEIPYAGGVLCAQRTIEHREMYKEGDEAAFWSGEDECIAVCKNLLENNILREGLRVGGMRKVRSLRVGNEDVCLSILQRVNL